MSGAYYMLIASLPHLPHFLRAERLPINPQRLRWRRAVLEPDDALDLDRALSVLQWQPNDLARTDSETDRLFRARLQDTRNEALRDYLDYRMGLRSAVAGLRRKQRGLPAPSRDDRCGVGRWALIVCAQWDTSEFGLSALYPCLPRVRELLDEGRAAELEKTLMTAIWSRLCRIEDQYPFGFEAVFAYVFKWDILARWLSHNPAQATETFQSLVQEILHEQPIRFK